MSAFSSTAPSDSCSARRECARVVEEQTVKIVKCLLRQSVQELVTPAGIDLWDWIAEELKYPFPQVPILFASIIGTSNLDDSKVIMDAFVSSAEAAFGFRNDKPSTTAIDKPAVVRLNASKCLTAAHMFASILDQIQEQKSPQLPRLRLPRALWHTQFLHYLRLLADKYEIANCFDDKKRPDGEKRPDDEKRPDGKKRPDGEKRPDDEKRFDGKKRPDDGKQQHPRPPYRMKVVILIDDAERVKTEVLLILIDMCFLLRSSFNSSSLSSPSTIHSLQNQTILLIGLVFGITMSTVESLQSEWPTSQMLKTTCLGVQLCNVSDVIRLYGRKLQEEPALSAAFELHNSFLVPLVNEQGLESDTSLGLVERQIMSYYKLQLWATQYPLLFLPVCISERSEKSNAGETTEGVGVGSGSIELEKEKEERDDDGAVKNYDIYRKSSTGLLIRVFVSKKQNRKGNNQDDGLYDALYGMYSKIVNKTFTIEKQCSSTEKTKNSKAKKGGLSKQQMGLAETESSMVKFLVARLCYSWCMRHQLRLSRVLEPPTGRQCRCRDDHCRRIQQRGGDPITIIDDSNKENVAARPIKGIKNEMVKEEIAVDVEKMEPELEKALDLYPYILACLHSTGYLEKSSSGGGDSIQPNKEFRRMFDKFCTALSPKFLGAQIGFMHDPTPIGSFEGILDQINLYRNSSEGCCPDNTDVAVKQVTEKYQALLRQQMGSPSSRSFLNCLFQMYAIYCSSGSSTINVLNWFYEFHKICVEEEARGCNGEVVGNQSEGGLDSEDNRLGRRQATTVAQQTNPPEICRPNTRSRGASKNQEDEHLAGPMHEKITESENTKKPLLCRPDLRDLFQRGLNVFIKLGLISKARIGKSQSSGGTHEDEDDESSDWEEKEQAAPSQKGKGGGGSAKKSNASAELEKFKKDPEAKVFVDAVCKRLTFSDWTYKKS